MHYSQGKFRILFKLGELYWTPTSTEYTIQRKTRPGNPSVTFDLPIQLTEIRGTLLIPLLDEPGFKVVPDGLVSVDDKGCISEIKPAPDQCLVPETRPGSIWMPGFVDTHIHFPQTRVIGSASGPLLDWLTSTLKLDDEMCGRHSTGHDR